MATSEQLLALIKAHYDSDEERFKTLTLQIAAHEAKIGHSNLAQNLKEITMKRSANVHTSHRQYADNNLMVIRTTSNRKCDLIVSEKLSKQIDNLILEFMQRSKLNKNGYNHRRKILLEGKPGTGKTFTASILSNELKLPLYIIQTDKLISKYMGETGTKLRQIFDSIATNIGIYFFDEFDSIGSDRGSDNDVKEMHRVLNLFLQFIEQDMSESIIMAATNSGKLLDSALFRRFDDVLKFDIPTKQEIAKLIKLKLSKYVSDDLLSDEIASLSYGLCHGDITKACENAIKYAILHDKKHVEYETLKSMIIERKNIYGGD